MGAIKGKKLDPVTCPFCGFSSKRLTSFDSHMGSQHDKTSEAAWVELNGAVLCKCGCGEKPRWLGWKQGYQDYILGHNGNLSMLGEEGEKIKEARRQTLQRSLASGDFVPWARGRTKDNDPTVAAAAAKRSATVRGQFASGQRAAWSKGLTKNTDDRVRGFSITMKRDFSEGRREAWAKGLRKETSPSIRRMAMNVSIALRKEGIRSRLDSVKRLSVEEVVARVESSGKLSVVGGMDLYVNDLSPVIQVRCKSCGDTYSDSLRRLQRGKCFSCTPGGSAAQEEVAAFIASLGLEVKRNVRSLLSGLEIDVYVPSKNFGVEYNGLYWHSELHKSSTYHENKTATARGAGISVLQVFEDDWRDRRPIVESLIKHRLGMSSSRLNARSLKIREMPVSERRRFFDANHIDGDTPSVVAWCLCNATGEPIAGISLRKPFHKTYGDLLEVARFCTKKDTSVRGGLSRLAKVAKAYCLSREVKGLLTYVDNRLGGGGGYEAAGFKLVGKTPPRFWWTDFDTRMNRFKFRADPSQGMTEAAVADEAGVVRIWGCSNLVYRLDVC